jgi:hypothetical protein
MFSSVGFVSVTPAELNYHLNIGEKLEFEKKHYITFSSTFKKFLSRKLGESEEIHFVEDFRRNNDIRTDYNSAKPLIENILDGVPQKQSFMYSDYRYQERHPEEQLIQVSKTNEFWRHILSEYNIEYIFSCSGGEYIRRCGFYTAQEFNADFYFTYSAFPSKDNSRVVFEPTEMQQIIEGNRSDPLTQTEARKKIEQFRENSNSEFSRNVTNLPVNSDNIRSLINGLKGEAKIGFSETQTDFGWNIVENIQQKFREHLTYLRNRKIYLSEIPEDDFVLLALHSNQDAQITCREPRFFNNQLGLVRAISNLLPHAYKLVVKQHPVATGQNAPGELRRLQSEHSNVEFIDPKIPPSALFDEALATVTIRSTIGLEALLHGCSVVTFGNPYYTNTEATISASFDNIEKPLINAIQHDGPTLTELENLVSYLWGSSYPGDQMGRLEEWNVPYLVAGIESLVNKGD